MKRILLQFYCVHDVCVSRYQLSSVCRYSDCSEVQGWDSWISCKILQGKCQFKLHFMGGSTRQRKGLSVIFLKMRISVIWILVQDRQILLPFSIIGISKESSTSFYDPPKDKICTFRWVEINVIICPQQHN